MSDRDYVTARELHTRYDISASSLRTWAARSEIRTIKRPGRHPRYQIDDVLDMLPRRRRHAQKVSVLTSAG